MSPRPHGRRSHSPTAYNRLTDKSVGLLCFRAACWGRAASRLAKTFRPDNFLASLVKRMRDRKAGSVLITNSDGVLIGVLYRQDAEARLNEVQATEQASG